MYVKDEASFDQFHKNVNNISRIVSKNKREGKTYQDGNTGYLQGPRFAQNVPGIQSFVRVQSGTEDLKSGTEIQPQDLMYVDSNFFSVFSFPLLSGDTKTCLAEPHSIGLSEDAAKKQFGTKDVVGKLVMIKDDSAFVPMLAPADAGDLLKDILSPKPNTHRIKNVHSTARDET